MSYNEAFLASLPDICTSGRSIWSSTTALICRAVVELHLPRRCIRQLGHVQDIPTDEFLLTGAQHTLLHAMMKGGRIEDGFNNTYQSYLQLWVERLQRTFRVYYTPVMATPDYLRWYLPRTLMFMQHPEHRAAMGFVGGSEHARAQVIYLFR